MKICLIFIPIIFKNSGVDTSPAEPGGVDWTERVNWGSQGRGGEISPNLENRKVSRGFFRKEFRPDRSQYSDRSLRIYNEAPTNYQVAGGGKWEGPFIYITVQTY